MAEQKIVPITDEKTLTELLKSYSIEEEKKAKIKKIEDFINSDIISNKFMANAKWTDYPVWKNYLRSMLTDNNFALWDKISMAIFV